MQKICIFDKLPSTNLYAKEFITSDSFSQLSPSDMAFLAYDQSQGVGKLGKSWQSDPGNLHLTLALSSLNKNIQPQNYSIISLITSLAVRETLKRYLDKEISIRCKWPNDILINQEKICGILLETEQTKKGLEYLIIGVGVNLLKSPQIMNYKTTNLYELMGEKVPPLNFAYALLEIFNSLLLRLSNDRNFIIHSWQQGAYLLNQEVLIKVGESTKKGVFKGISQEGYLIMDTGKGLTNISAGEIFKL
ncbi:Biotin--[acetyl-CoA-carboxylase] ligase [Candidatus Hepatincolaceae symbiont of Richtersius coronifer]